MFAEDNDLKSKWIYFVNRKDWQPRKYSVIRIKYFKTKFVKLGEKCKSQWHLDLLSTIHLKIYGKNSLLRTRSLPRKLPVKRNIYGNEISLFQARDKVSSFQHFDCFHSPLKHSFKHLDETVQHNNLVFNEQTAIATMIQCISVNKDLQVD